MRNDPIMCLLILPIIIIIIFIIFIQKTVFLIKFKKKGNNAKKKGKKISIQKEIKD
jgi:uncharacterized membrane protein